MQLNARKRQPVAAFWYSALLPLFLSFFIVILGLFLAALLYPVADPSLVSGVALFSLFVSAIVLSYPALYYLLFTYEIHEGSMTVNSGILFRQYETIDFKKIQTIDNERGPLLMLFGLTVVEIWTASADQIRSGIGRDAMRIRPRPDMRFILEKSSASELRDFIMHAKG